MSLIQLQYQVENDGDDEGSDNEIHKSKDRELVFNSRGLRWRAYKTYIVRKKSFNSCSSESIRKRDQYFAENGFFYKGYGFSIVCFFCGFELDAKDENIDVHTSHTKAKPDCGYIHYKEVNLQRDHTAQEREICQHADSVAALQVTETASSKSETRDVEPMEDSDQVLQSLRCKVCLDNQVRITFQPCGHLAACDACASRLIKCPVCRANIRERIKTYLS